MDTQLPSRLPEPARCRAGLVRYRRQAFIARLGWALCGCGDPLSRRFDRGDAVHVVTHSSKPEITGTARLVPSTRPYRIGEVCPELFHGRRLPLAEVWELSRFAAVDFSNSASTAMPSASASSLVAHDLLHKAITCAAERGARRLVTVSTLGIERLMRKAGFKPHRAGPPMTVRGKPTFVCWIDI